MKQAYLSEFLGTYGLVFAGTGAIVINEISGGAIGHQGIAAVFGLVVIAMIYAFGEISGAHINPAVTLAFWAAGRFEKNKIAPYLLFQFLGAIAASLTLLALFPEATTMGETLPAGSVWQTFILEFILSFFLMQVIMNVSSGSKETGIMAGLAIGVTVWLEALFAGPISGASMNPFRSLAPAIASMDFTAIWVYIAAPILGMYCATLSCRILKTKDCCPMPGQPRTC